MKHNHNQSTDRQATPTRALSRRELLKKSIPVAGALALPTIVPASVFGDNAPSNRITLGFIGLGIHGLGWNLPRFIKHKDAQAVAVCDVVQSRAEEGVKAVNRKYGNKDCKNYSELARHHY